MVIIDESGGLTLGSPSGLTSPKAIIWRAPIDNGCLRSISGGFG